MHTRVSLCCSCVFYTTLIMAACVSLVSLAGADGYNQESFSLKNQQNPRRGHAVGVDSRRLIIAYESSLNESYVAAQWFQKNEDGSFSAPETAPCTEVYAGQGGDGLFTSGMQCIKQDELYGNQMKFQQVGASTRFYLAVTACKLMSNYYFNTMHKPYDFSVDDCEADSLVDLQNAQENGFEASFTVYIFGQQFEEQTYRDGNTEQKDMPYYLLSKNKMGFLNNTQIETTFDISHVDAQVSNTIFDNSHFARIAPRNRLSYYNYNSQFQTFNSYYNDLDAHVLGASPMYLKAQMRLSSTEIVQQVALNRGLIATLAASGSFMFGVYILLSLMARCLDFYMIEKSVVDELTTYAKPRNMSLTRKKQVVSMIRHQAHNDTGTFQRALSYGSSCCNSGEVDRNTMLTVAKHKVDRETDLVEMVTLLREFKFMQYNLSQDRGKFAPLVRYSQKYRIETPYGPDRGGNMSTDSSIYQNFVLEDPFETVDLRDPKLVHDQWLAHQMTGDSLYETTLRDDIVGTALERLQRMSARSRDRLPGIGGFPGQYSIQDED